MPAEILNGDQALAHGALEAGVKVVTGYPGSPSSGTVGALLSLTRADQVYIEWSTNEKVALEMGIGASLAGRRALVCVKSVGMNAMMDPLMAVNLTGVNAGLVILLGDDPGAYGSQNDQDTRPIAAFAEVPLMEPSTPREAKAMMLEAYDVSERYQTVVIVRETRSFSQKGGAVEITAGPHEQPALPMIREGLRWVPYPANAVEKHRALHAKLAKLRAWANESTFNRSEGLGRKGIVGAGFAYEKVLDIVGENRDGLRLFKLGTIYPAPERMIAEFLENCDAALVLEENEPYVETQIKALAHGHRLQARILGKLSGHVPREGELFRWQIQQALERFIDGFVPGTPYARSGEPEERPPREDYCSGCPYLEILWALKEVGHELGQEPVLVGDPGCLVKAAHLLDAKYALGSAAAVAQGMIRAGMGERALAIFGDSAFFHTGLSALINAVHNQAPVLMIVLDNSATATTGFQPNPGTGLDTRGRPAPKLSIEGIARACGVEYIATVGPEDGDEKLRATFRDGIQHDGLGLIVVRKPCERPQ